VLGSIDKIPAPDFTRVLPTSAEKLPFNVTVVEDPSTSTVLDPIKLNPRAEFIPDPAITCKVDPDNPSNVEELLDPKLFVVLTCSVELTTNRSPVKALLFPFKIAAPPVIVKEGAP
jgi:hypothetical protein